MIEKHCLYCGAEIPEPENKKTNIKRYCSRKCARKAAAEKSAEANRRRREEETAQARAKRESGLEACMQEAERLGISYGQYMARRGQP